MPWVLSFFLFRHTSSGYLEKLTVPDGIIMSCVRLDAAYLTESSEHGRNCREHVKIITLLDI